MFLAVWFFTWRDASAIIRMSRDSPDLKWAGQLAAMLQVSLIGFFVGGAFLNLANWDMPYYMLVAIVVTHDIVKRTVDAKSVTPWSAFRRPIPAGARVASEPTGRVW